MGKEYDLSAAVSGSGTAVEQPNKTRTTIVLDRDVIAGFRTKDMGSRYPITINQALRKHLASDEL